MTDPQPLTAAEALLRLIAAVEALAEDEQGDATRYEVGTALQVARATLDRDRSAPSGGGLRDCSHCGRSLDPRPYDANRDEPVATPTPAAATDRLSGDLRAVLVDLVQAHDQHFDLRSRIETLRRFLRLA